MKDFQSVELDKSEGHCTVYPLAKQSRLPFPLSNTVSTTHAFIQFMMMFGVLTEFLNMMVEELTMDQNRVAKRRRGYILDTARALRFQASVPLKFCGEYALTAVYVINRIPTPTLQGRCPYEVLYGHLPSLKHLRVFGCLGYVTDLKRGDIFSPRVVPTIFLGYSLAQKGYKMYVIHSRSFQVRREVVFKENVFLFKHLPTTISSLFPVLDLTTISATSPSMSSLSDTAESAELALDNVVPEAIVQPLDMLDTPAGPIEIVDGSNLLSHDISMPSNVPELSRKFTRTSRPPVWLKDYVTQKQGNSNCCYPMSKYVSYANISQPFSVSLTAYSAIAEPQSYSKVVKQIDRGYAIRDCNLRG
ncbi:uncharacterized protein LOC142162992 [Nicotiana tabacum]|uniref:Uncharacterized protein LOC142162992 n=1 Tax=Nicotiana tabacum TaxID=4097 RepID=A0AC58RUC9_TOBAC